MLEFGKWLKVFDFKNLEGFFSGEKGRGGIGDALITVLAANLIYQVPITTISILSVMILGSASGSYSGYSAYFGGSPILALIALMALGVAVQIALFFLMNITQHMIAAALGGAGKYGDLLCLDSYIIAAGNLVALVLGFVPAILTLIPSVGTTASGLLTCILFPLGIIATLYMLYALYHVIRINYGLTGGRAIISIVINLLLWAVVAGILMIVYYALFIASVLGGPGLLGFGY